MSSSLPRNDCATPPSSSRSSRSPRPSPPCCPRCRCRFFSSRRRHTRSLCDWSSDVCSSDLLEAKDEYTSSHTRWIAEMALKVGEQLGFDREAQKRLELGALFHDIGKIGIPASILLKPGPLTPDERRVMEMHPELGERILEPIDRLAEVRPIV